MIKSHIRRRFRTQIMIRIFQTEDQLESIINNFKPDIIIKGNDRPDIRTVLGSKNWPVCIIPRLKDKEGKDFSTTRKLNE